MSQECTMDSTRGTPSLDSRISHPSMTYLTARPSLRVEGKAVGQRCVRKQFPSKKVMVGGDYTYCEYVLAHIFGVQKQKRLQLEYPSVRHWDYFITFAVGGGRFQIRDQSWIPQLKLHRAWYLIFVVKSQNMLVWLVATKRCFPGGFKHKIGPVSSKLVF